MPPKGWRKNADGSYPQPTKQPELVSIDEILFPRSIVQRLAKDIVQEIEGGNVIMAKDAIMALQRSATVFVSHMFFQGRNICRSDLRKTVNAQDIISALEKSGYSSFVPEVKQKLSLFEAELQEKKLRKVNPKSEVEADTKRLKTNTDASDIMPNAFESEEEQFDDDDDNDVNDDTNDVVEIDDDIEDDGDNEPNTSSNPIALLSKDEGELEGSTIEEVKEESSDDEDD